MNKFLCWLLLSILFIHTEGCRRRRLQRSAPPLAATTSVTDSLRSETPAQADRTRPGSTTLTAGATPADSAGTGTPARPGIEEARANVAEIDFTYLAAKSKFSFRSNGNDTDNANINLRVRKDSLIWFSVQKLGLEVARGLITPDSITVVDRVHKAYFVYDFPALSQRFNFSLSYGLLQSLIVGNLPLPKRPAQKIKNERDYLLLRQSEGKVLVENYIGEQDRKLKKLLVTEQPTQNTLRLDYEDFTTLNSFLFPYTSLISLDYKSEADGQFYQTVLRIQHSKVELLDKNPGFPFSIPPRYERRQ